MINRPEQHYANGVDKNKRTGGRFKLIVRAVKRLQRAKLENYYFPIGDGVSV